MYRPKDALDVYSLALAEGDTLTVEGSGSWGLGLWPPATASLYDHGDLQPVATGGSLMTYTVPPGAAGTYHLDVVYSYDGYDRPPVDYTLTYTIEHAAVQTFTLTYIAGSGGTISGATSQTVESGASGTTVTAVPDTGYLFTGWSDGKTGATRTDANVTADLTVTASFEFDLAAWNLARLRQAVADKNLVEIVEAHELRRKEAGPRRRRAAVARGTARLHHGQPATPERGR